MGIPLNSQSIAGDASNSPVAGVSLIIDPAGLARVTPRGLDYTGASGLTPGGHFRTVLKTGLTTGMGANAPIASLRWAPAAGNLMLALLGVHAEMVITTAFTTPQAVDLEMFVARGFTAADSGGTAVVLSGNNQKMRDGGGGVAMSASQIADLRAATTAALTAGTRTLDTTAIGSAVFGQSNVVGNADQRDLYRLEPADHALILAANEGLVFQVPTAQGAVGVVKYVISIKHAEILTY